MSSNEKIKFLILSISMGIIYIFFALFSKQISNYIFSMAITFACLIYFIGFYLVDFNRISSKIIILFSLIYSTILFTTPINLSSDTTAYVLGARVAFIGKQNPFTTSYFQFKDDTIYHVFRNYTWVEYPYTYSPLFLYISGIFLYFAGNNFMINILIFRMLFLITFISSIFVFFKISKNIKALYLFLFNPIILNELIKEAHVESLLIVILLTGVYLFLHKKYLASFLSYISAFLIKINFIIFIPLVLIHIYKSGNYTIKKTFFIIALGITVIILAYLPFWQGISIFSRIIGLISGSKFPLININFLCLALMPITFLSHKSLYDSYVLSGQILFILGAITLILYSIKLFLSKTDLLTFVKSTNFSYFIYLFFLINWFFPHYATISLVLSALAFGFKEESIYLKYIFILTIYSSLYYILPL